MVMVMSFGHWHRGWDGQSGTRSTTRASPGAQGVLGEPAAPGPTQRQWARRPSHDSGSAGSMPVVASNDHRAAISVPAAARPPGPASSGVPVTMPPCHSGKVRRSLVFEVGSGIIDGRPHVAQAGSRLRAREGRVGACQWHSDRRPGEPVYTGGPGPPARGAQPQVDV